MPRSVGKAVWATTRGCSCWLLYRRTSMLPESKLLLMEIPSSGFLAMVEGDAEPRPHLQHMPTAAQPLGAAAHIQQVTATVMHELHARNATQLSACLCLHGQRLGRATCLPRKDRPRETRSGMPAALLQCYLKHASSILESMRCLTCIPAQRSSWTVAVGNGLLHFCGCTGQPILPVSA